MNKLNCPNCGAPITGIKCEYCGSMFYDFAEINNNEPKYLRINFNGEIVWCNAVMTSANITMVYGGLPEMEINFRLYPDTKGRVIYQRRTKNERFNRQTGGD